MMAKGKRGEGLGHAESIAHAEDCSGCESFAPVHDQYDACGLCGLADRKSALSRKDVVSQKPVCDGCWEKYEGDHIEVARQISGKSASLDHDHGRILGLSDAA